MKTMKWLLRREFWENKGSMLWAPVIVSLIMLLFVGGTMIYLGAADHIGGKVTVNGHTANAAGWINAMPAEAKQKMGEQFAAGYLAIAAPLFGVMSFVIFFYCLSALYDDRRDRSILFWKSLPITDELTVLSKVATALCVVPLITLALAMALSVGLLIIGSTVLAANGFSMFGTIFGSADFYLAPFRLLTLLPVYIIWALPSVGWLLMVSAWARSKVFLWAVGIPLLTLILVKWITYLLGELGNGFTGANWLARNVVVRGLVGLEPGSWFLFTLDSPSQLHFPKGQGVDWSAVVQYSWSSLATADAIYGAIAGVAMIFVALRLRRWRDEG